ALDGALHVERLVDGAAVLVQAAHEGLDAALEVVGDALPDAVVDEVDPDALREEGHLAEALGEGREVELRLTENIRVGDEPGRRAGVQGAVAAELELPGCLPAPVTLTVALADARDLDL